MDSQTKDNRHMLWRVSTQLMSSPTKIRLSQVTTRYEGSRVGCTACKKHTLNNWLRKEWRYVERGRNDDYWNGLIKKSTIHLHVLLNPPDSSNPFFVFTFHFFCSSRGCSRPQPLIYQINRITFPIRMSFYWRVGSYRGSHPCNSSGNCKHGGLQRHWHCTCDIN